MDVEWDGLEGALAEARRSAGDRHRGPAHGAESPGVPWEPSLGRTRAGPRRSGGGVCVHRQLTHVATQQKPTPHCKAITLQFKKCDKK